MNDTAYLHVMQSGTHDSSSFRESDSLGVLFQRIRKFGCCLRSPVCLEYYTVMEYGERLLLRFLCLLITRLYVVVLTACPESPFTDSFGTISSPGFNTSSQYEDNLRCTYSIIVPANRRVILEVKNLSILGVMPDCEGDSLEILVG